MKRVVVPSINNFGPIQTKEGEYIEEKVRRITENGEPIEDGAPIIYTERKDGVNPAYNIRTDRWEIAQDAMEQVGNNKSKIISVIRDEKSASMISSLEELLGGSRKDAIKQISDSGSNGHHNARNGGSNSKSKSLLQDIQDDIIEAHIEHSDSDNEDNNE